MSTRQKVVLIGLYSDRYPAIGETHGVSAIAGYLGDVCCTDVRVLDMVAKGQQQSELAIALCREVQPAVVGLSVTYGTFDYAVELWARLQAVVESSTRFVFGGALATFLAEDLLRATGPDSLVVIGEGEEALAMLVRGESVKTIPNLCFLEADGAVRYTARRPVDLTVPYLPRRVLQKGVQYYTEASRGCSWAHCTFCLRGLLDIKGRGSEYRQFPAERIASDLVRLAASGMSSVTFADEDLLGASGKTAEHVATALRIAQKVVSRPISVDASLTVHSVCSRRMTTYQREARTSLLREFRTLGLRKVFLGVESASSTQLKRYAKGHSIEEVEQAVRILLEIGFELELGWIPFDPLCTIGELRDNFTFLEYNQLASTTSYLFNELRIQRESKYHMLVKGYEERMGSRLLESTVDRNTLSLGYRYASESVQSLADSLHRFAPRLRKLHYPMKNLTRFGEAGALGESIDHGRALVREMRQDLCSAFLAVLQSKEAEISPKADEAFKTLLPVLAAKVLAWTRSLPTVTRDLEIVRRLESDAATESTLL